MGAVQRMAEQLRSRPELVIHVTEDTLRVEPPSPNGFAMYLTEGDGWWLVGFDGWHEQFASEEEALNCFAFGLSDCCRLRVHYRGSFPHRWTVEERTTDGWREDSATGLLLFPFWRRARIEYRQNALSNSS